MKRFALLIALLVSANAFGQSTTISALPAGGALTGSESIPMDQTACASPATCKTTPAAVVTYVNGHATIPLATGVTGNLPLANMASIATSTVVGNASGSTGTPTALNPLAVANMQSAMISVDFVATSALTLSGVQTVDGVSVANGQFVLVTANTATTGCTIANSGCQNGIYVANTSGAWTRALNFPAGYVIAQNCELVIKVKLGTNFVDSAWYVPTAAGSITINSTGFTPTELQEYATTTRFGKVKTTSAANLGSLVPLVSGTIVANDCTAFNDSSGDLSDIGDISGNKGYCVTMNQTSGHVQITNVGGLAVPSVNHGTLNADATDQWGIISGLSAATTVTVTFSTTFTVAPACVANDSTATAVGVTTTATAATFTFTSLTGSLTYFCQGTS